MLRPAAFPFCLTLLLAAVSASAAAPPPPPPPPLQVLSPSPLPSDIQWSLSAGTGGERGVLPIWVPTLALGVGIRSTLASLDFEVHTGAPLNWAAENGATVRAFSATGTLAGCFHGVGVEILFLCTITSLGTYFDGAQRSVTTDVTGTYFGSGLRAGVEIPVATGRFGFFLRGEALYTFCPLSVWQNEQNVWQSGDVTGSAQGGVRFFL